MTTARKLPILSTSVALSLRIMVELKQMVREKHLREAPAAMQLVIFAIRRKYASQEGHTIIGLQS